MNWLYYLAEANIYLGVFYLAYCLFLNRDTHYQLNRAYLIFSCIVSFILPVLQIGVLRPVKPAEHVNTINYARPVQAVKIITQEPQTITSTTAPVIEHHFTLQDGLWYVYLIGAAVFLFMLFIKLYTLFKLTRNVQSVKEGKHRVIYLTGTDAAFSFFNYLFIGTNATGANTIIRHELVHIRQKHSADIIFLELLKIMNWFNPFVYLLQNSLKAVHEYIADEQTAAYETDALTYSSFLVSNTYGTGGSSITHSFFNYNLLKKRIIMLNQKRSGNLARLKYLVAIPICVALLCASTLAFSKTYGWVDLIPANIKPAGRYAMVNINHAVKRKHLKVTQNGVTITTDQFSVDQKNKKVVYKAGTITKADRSLLLKNHNIKVEVVEDSTLFTTKDGKLFLPVVNVDGYYLLDHFLHHNIHYTSAKGEKGGLVEVGFALDKDRHITGAKVVKSGGPKLDAMALNGFKAYKGIINDDAGKNYKIGVYFFTDDYSIFKTDSLGKDPEFAGELIITNYNYPVNLTSKGYEYDESGIGFPGDDNNMSNAKVVIYEKNGEANWYYKSKSTPADLKLLKDKYGYTFPSSASAIVQMMYPKNVKNKRLAYIFDVASYLDAPYSNHFYNHIINNIEYPQQAQKTLTGGVVVLNFNLGNDGMISDVNVAQGAGNGFDEAAVNALQSYKFAIKDNAGKHSIAILFCVAEKKYRPVVSEKMKKDGYVGELSVSDVKSPFMSTSVKFPPPVIAPGSPKAGVN
ncbi:TonB family protein [Mucilaginibacter sp. McL0603]|uniref:TonB family protein n=1 Tax=Mucilaginibacter sp. McL0603 TaxID=3415670 RepID=UPI003CF83400